MHYFPLTSSKRLKLSCTARPEDFLLEVGFRYVIECVLVMQNILMLVVTCSEQLETLQMKKINF